MVKTGSVSVNRPSVTSTTVPSDSRASRIRDSGRGPGWDQAEPGRIRSVGQPGHGTVGRRRQLAHLAGSHVHHEQAAVARGNGDGRPVRRGRQVRNPAELARGQPARAPGGQAGRDVGGRDLQRLLAIGVGHPHDLAGPAQHPGEPRPQRNRERAGGPVAVGQPVHGAADLHRAGPAGVIAGQIVQVVLGGDQPGAARRGRGGELDVDRPGLAGQVVQDPDVPRAVVHDALAVGARVAGVEAVVVGVPPQIGAVQRARVQVARALVVGEEHQPPGDDHRAADLAGQRPRHRGEPRLPRAGRAGILAGPWPPTAGQRSRRGTASRTRARGAPR